MSNPAQSELWRSSATELADAYRSGATTPDAVLAATLERLDAANPSINAVVTLDRDGAQEAALESTTRWRNRAPLGPLDGVPVTIKDNILVRGLRATWGSRLYTDHVPAVDETPVARLRDAGAVILGKNNVPEFTLHGFTANALFGVTRNPWNIALTPGGSSGGAVAAVASGIGPLALGTDGGGSIRRPAAHTGLFGLKPSRGIVPRENGFPPILHDFEVAGPVARSLNDIAAAMEVIGGAQWRNRIESPAGKRYRIVYTATFDNAPVEPSIHEAVTAVASAFAAMGHHVERVESLDITTPITEAWPVISSCGLHRLLKRYDGAEDLIQPALADIARQGARHSAADYSDALARVRAVGHAFEELFAKADALLTPAAAAMPWPADKSHPETIAGRPVGPRGHAVFTPFANALGLPAISAPCRDWPDGMPIGFQLSAPLGSDRLLLNLVSEYERNSGPLFRWPPDAPA